MARVLCIDDYPLYAEMVAAMLRGHGHEVEAVTVPLVLDEALAFDPELILLNLVRKAEVLGQPITHFETEVDGAKALIALGRHAAAGRIPLIVTALAVEESALPRGLRYEAFVNVPIGLPQLLVAIDRIAGKPPGTLLTD